MSGAWKVRQTQPARQDRTAIIRWTIKHFGPDQAGTYAETIALALAALRNGPDSVGIKKRDDLGNGIHTLHVACNERKGRHFIVFRIGDPQTIDVLRLLHDSMDLAAHLAE
ncbi:MAG: type II toxin-antitoxin system RelE/ParE family toxin [Ottowia sp.]|uniref:type II toxin-antitoxin system RelE/ParE family toxin n=1 Tax=Ottowia sp. TaxID=1898956 RepID=UPI0039E3D9CA